MSYVFECIETRLIAESVAAAGITFQNDVIITNNSTFVTNGTVTINENTIAGPAMGALIVTGGASIGSGLVGPPLPINALDMNGLNIRNGPTSLSAFPLPGDYLTRAAVEALATGLNVFPSTKFATISAINTFVTPTTGANVITSTTNEDINVRVGTLFDTGITILLGDRVLVKDDDRATPGPPPDDVINGIYEVTDLGSGATPWVLTRVTNFEVGDNVYQAYTLVTDGDTQQGGWIENGGTNPTTVGTNAISFTLFSQSGGQNLESVLNVGNLTGTNSIIIDTGSGGILSTAGQTLIVNAGTDTLQLSGNTVAITSTANTTINAVNVTTTATGNVLDNVTGTSTTNAAGITLASTAGLTASGTTASLTANTGDLTLTSTAGTVNINDAVGGVSIDTGTNTITVNTGDVVITAPLPQDIVGALNALQTSVVSATRQRVSHQLLTIPLKSLDAFPTIKPIYWTWFESRYGTGGMDYTNPVLVFEVVGNDIVIQVRNQTLGVDLLAPTVRSAGFYAEPLPLNVPPTANAEIFVQIRSQTAGFPGELRGVSLEWIANNPV